LANGTSPLRGTPPVPKWLLPTIRTPDANPHGGLEAILTVSAVVIAQRRLRGHWRGGASQSDCRLVARPSTAP